MTVPLFSLLFLFPAVAFGAPEKAALFSDSHPLDLNFLEDVESLKSGDGRALWTGRDKSTQCRGTITTLKRDEATVLKSHYGFGQEPYPDNYQCRWLFVPESCDLGIECQVDTYQKRSRSSRLGKCAGADYLRVVGYRGAMDSFYCGDNESLNVTFGGSDAVAVLFRSLGRPENQKRQAIDFGGFNCKIVCRAPGAVPPNALQPNIVSQTTTSTTTEEPAAEFNLTSVLVPASTDPKEDDDDDCKCGQTRQGRIVCPPGQECTAGLGAIPWQAAIVYKNKIQPWCGGSLISERYVLTAAHCLKGKTPDKIQIVLGDHDWTTKSETRDNRFDAAAIAVHPAFDRVAKFDYDFALVKLSRPARFDENVRPVCLPERELRFLDELVGRSGRASGWGVVDPSAPNVQSRKLQAVSVAVMPNAECGRKYRPNPITHNMLCAVTPRGDACFGDSGGPFTVKSSGRHVLEGVISWGKNCAKERWPGVYARVRNVLDWIEDNTKDSRFCSVRGSIRRGRSFEGEGDEFLFGRGDRRN